MLLKFEDVPGWFFVIDEVSAGFFRIEAKDVIGSSYTATGLNSDKLIEQCKSWIKQQTK